VTKKKLFFLSEMMRLTVKNIRAGNNKVNEKKTENHVQTESERKKERDRVVV